MIERIEADRRLWWPMVSAIALAGLLLRLAASRGGLWTDEAWSMLYAEQARTPLGVFLRINHDNNHHLISLWLQLVGIDAPAWLIRLPAALAGSISIIIAAMLTGWRSRLAGITAALLFAFSPIMVTYGSEARGYAPMMLAALAMLLLVMNARDKGPGHSIPWGLGLISLLGMLSHMTMAAPVVLVSLWIYLESRAAEGPSEGLRTTVKLMGPALGAAALVPLFVMAAAWASPTGMQVGGYMPFDWSELRQALDDLSGWTFGLTSAPPFVPLLAASFVGAILAIRPPKWLSVRARLYSILILGVPLAVSFFHPANTGFARYFLCSAIGLLLVASEWIARMFEANAGARLGAAAALCAVLLVSLRQDFELIRIERGHPEAIVGLMRKDSPAGGSLALENERLESVTRLAAIRDGYRLRLVRGCAPADFFVSSQPGRLSEPANLVRCGVPMHPIGRGLGTALTGDRWILFARNGFAPAQFASL